MGLQLGGCEVGVGVGFWDCDVDMNLLCCDGWPQQDPEEHDWKCSCNGPEGRFRLTVLTPVEIFAATSKKDGAIH